MHSGWIKRWFHPFKSGDPWDITPYKPWATEGNPRVHIGQQREKPKYIGKRGVWCPWRSTQGWYGEALIKTAKMMNIYVHVFFLIRPYIQSFVHARIRAFLHSCILTFLHSYIHAFIHTYVHSFVYIYIFIYLCFLLRSQSLMVFVQVCGLVGFLGSHAYSHTSHATYIRNAFGYTWKWDILSNGHFNGDNDG